MNVLIVESNAKARTLQKYLGKGWKVVATGGHIQTLPSDRRKHGKDGRKAYWSNRRGQLPKPPWVWTDVGEKALRSILDAAGDDPVFYLASDPDREGEFIAWRLRELLSEHGPTKRVTFQEVTEDAVKEAIAEPGDVDESRVESALVRKFLDRLVGFRTSKLARSMLKGGSASMGRVQTPTLGFVVERELEREAHVPIPYFEVRASAEGTEFRVRFNEPSDDEVWRDESNKAYPTRTFDGELAADIFETLDDVGTLTLTNVKRSTRSSRPKTPFTTDSLLQECGSRLGWSPRKTSALASMLYEAGHISYIRTDSTRLGQQAVDAARKAIADTWDDDHLGKGAKASQGKGPVQDAHEAIRPTRMEVDEAPVDDADARKLYRLIRARTLASQMAPSKRAIVSLEAAAEGVDRPLTGSVSWRTFDGWEAAYAEFLGDTATEPPPVDLEEGAPWSLDEGTDEDPNPVLIEDETKPPPRYRPHTLVKAMKDAGIGRPSTYAKTVEKLENRRYVEIDGGALVPTSRGRGAWLDVAPLYAEEDSDVDLFSAEFTAAMEERLDAVAAGDEPAPSAWETWRDQIRELHNVARARRKSGDITPRLKDRLERMLQNTPEDHPRPDDLSSLTFQQGKDWVKQLSEAGIEPAPSSRQIAYMERLKGDLELSDDEAAALVDRGSLDEITTTAGMSALIDALREMYDERRPPSRKQTALIERLVEQLELSESEAAALVDLERFEELTGGRDGTASALIDELMTRADAQKKAKKAKKKAKKEKAKQGA